MENKKLHIFISWSKPAAEEMAKALKLLLDKIFPDEITVFVSSNMEPGDEFNLVISDNLLKSDLGIIIMTQNNVGEPWLNYETGALKISTYYSELKRKGEDNKSLCKPHLIPIIIDRKITESEKPFTNQCVEFKRGADSFYEKVISIITKMAFNNSVSAERENSIKTTFNKYFNNYTEKGKTINGFNSSVEKILNSRDYKLDVMQKKMQNKGTYYTRDQHLKELIAGLDLNKSKRIIIIGTPQKILRKTSDFIKWLQANPASKLFICYETETLLLERRKKEVVSTETHVESKNYVKQKIAERDNMKVEIEKHVTTNIFFVEFFKKISHFVTIDDTSIYTTPVFHKRSSDTFTLLFDEKEKQKDVIDYVKSKIETEVKGKTIVGATELITELDLIKSEIG